MWFKQNFKNIKSKFTNTEFSEDAFYKSRSKQTSFFKVSFSGLVHSLPP